MIGTQNNWSLRRERLRSLPRPTMCDLVKRNKTGSGPQTPSLAIIQTKSRPELLITKRDQEQLAQWRERSRISAGQGSLFKDPALKPPELEVIPWRFRYKYHCTAPSCNSHTQTIIDWEAAALWRRVRDKANWQDLMRQTFINKMWAENRKTELFVGNQIKYPQAFLVLGVFWPPSGLIQPSLLF